jgi:hypothetical protein
VAKAFVQLKYLRFYRSRWSSRLSSTILGGYAKFMQTSTADREWQEFQSTSNRENGSRTLVSRALVQDLL